MKTIKIIAIVFMASILMTSCGIHSATVSNTNNNVTHVELSRNNFKVIDRVSGTATATYIFGIGGLSNKALIEKAKANMLEKANIIGGSKAVINLTVESHMSLIYIYYIQKTVTVSGHVVEFTD